MALKQITGPTKRWIGLSTDEFPSSRALLEKERDQDLPPGSTVLHAGADGIEKTWRWTGERWAVDDVMGRMIRLLTNIDERLARLVELAEKRE